MAHRFSRSTLKALFGSWKRSKVALLVSCLATWVFGWLFQNQICVTSLYKPVLSYKLGKIKVCQIALFGFFSGLAFGEIPFWTTKMGRRCVAVVFDLFEKDLCVCDYLCIERCILLLLQVLHPVTWISKPWVKVCTHCQGVWQAHR